MVAGEGLAQQGTSESLRCKLLQTFASTIVRNVYVKVMVRVMVVVVIMVMEPIVERVGWQSVKRLWVDCLK